MAVEGGVGSEIRSKQSHGGGSRKNIGSGGREGIPADPSR